jgi:uncharacterized protein YutE (UPF0331/DUF86 family)
MDEVILNKVAVIERCLRRIAEEYEGHEDELMTNFSRQDAIVLNLLRACEATLDMAMRAIKLKKLGLPQDSREAFKVLDDAQLIPSEVAKRMRAMVGFRNTAVHDYQKLSLPILQTVLDKHLDDFRLFARYMLSIDKV